MKFHGPPTAHVRTCLLAAVNCHPANLKSLKYYFAKALGKDLQCPNSKPVISMETSSYWSTAAASKFVLSTRPGATLIMAPKYHR